MAVLDRRSVTYRLGKRNNIKSVPSSSHPAIVLVMVVLAHHRTICFLAVRVSMAVLSVYTYGQGGIVYTSVERWIPLVL